MGTLKAKLAKYRGQLLEPSGKKGEKGEGFDVLKSGDARAVMIGFPSVGKVKNIIIFIKGFKEFPFYSVVSQLFHNWLIFRNLCFSPHY